MNPISSTRASAVPPATAPDGSIQGAAGTSVMKKAASLQAAAVATLLQALPQPVPATTGSLGTRLDAWA